MGAPAARMAAHIAGQIRQDQLSAEGAHGLSAAF